MRICLVAVEYPPSRGGLSKNVGELSVELAKAGHRVTVFYPNHISPTQRPPNNITLRRVFSLCHPMNNHITPSLFYHLMRVDCDLIHAHDGFFFGTLVAYIVSRIRGKPFIVTHHTNPIQYSNPLKRLLQHMYLHLILKKIYSGSFSVIVSNDTNKALLKSLGITKISVIPLGIHPKMYHQFDSADITNLRLKLNLSDSDKVLLFIGRFFERKGVMNIIKVFHRVSKVVNNVKLIMVGGGPLASKVDNSIRERGLVDSVILTGYLPFEEVALFYHLADLTVVPSLEGETQAIVILESILAGTPVVASDLAVFTNLVTPTTGFLTKLGDVEEMSKTIIRVLQNDYELEKLKSSCLIFDLSTYYWENVIPKLIDLYSKAILHKDVKS